jgi:hypothetical protein
VLTYKPCRSTHMQQPNPFIARPKAAHVDRNSSVNPARFGALAEGRCRRR